MGKNYRAEAGVGRFVVSTLSILLMSLLFVKAGARAESGGMVDEEGNEALYVYAQVPGLAPSAHYSFSVQRVSELNADKKEAATNWLKPFAWFSKCPEIEEGEPLKNYYAPFIGGWTHTYCNFEMAEGTPIVVKITRLDKPGVPSGPIRKATAHPAHRVESVEVINGDVYVTLKNPALVAVDIDGQLDDRDTPRAKPDGWDNDVNFPHNNAKDGVHAVTIFANPLLRERRPSLDDPDTYYVRPGELPPDPFESEWKTLYFLPGIHNFSVDENGNERMWKPSDAYPIVSDKTYYIPGDAIVYGLFNNYSAPGGNERVTRNFKIFGYGTICGSKITHPRYLTYEQNFQQWLKSRTLFIPSPENCRIEGITVTDQPFHGVYMPGEKNKEYEPNYIRWIKTIAWRGNSDAAGRDGNSYIEDCFFRHQDDALYIRGMATRRVVFWSDANGTPLRGSFITFDRDAEYPSSYPEKKYIEDCDIIYARHVFANDSNSKTGIITGDAHVRNRKPSILADGSVNTAQHLVFKDIRVTDPRPQRRLIDFDAFYADGEVRYGDWAGLTFKNIHYKHGHTWGWKPIRLIGSETCRIRDWTFDQVYIEGVLLTRENFKDYVQLTSDEQPDPSFVDIDSFTFR